MTQDDNQNQQHHQKSIRDDRLFMEKAGILIAIGLLFIVFVLKFITIIDAVIILLVLVGLEFGIRFIRKKLLDGEVSRQEGLRPFDPKIDYEICESKCLEVGYRVQVIGHTPEPKYREKSSQPYNMHFRCRWFKGNGVVGRLMATMSMYTRAITAIEPDHWHIENSTRDWSGAPLDTQEKSQLFYLPQPQMIRPDSLVPQKAEKKSKEEQDEEGDDL